MQNIKNTARALDGTFWTGNSNDSVYGIFQLDESLYTNTNMPYRLTFKVYKSGYYANTNTANYDGGIMMDGTLQILDGVNGTINGNTIAWNPVNLNGLNFITMNSNDYNELLMAVHDCI